MNEINTDNIKIDGTFDEWIESIKVEIERLLAPKDDKDDKDDKYVVEVLDAPAWSENSGPIKVINIHDITYFSFGEKEFERARDCSQKSLESLLKVRFVDAVWSIEAIREDYFRLLRRFDPKHETPDEWLH